MSNQTLISQHRVQPTSLENKEKEFSISYLLFFLLGFGHSVGNSSIHFCYFVL